jgi:hypothetical protein
MLLFRSEGDVEGWCQVHGIPKNPLVNGRQLWWMAKIWYGSRLETDYQRPAVGEVASIFASIGLDGPFWDPMADH